MSVVEILREAGFNVLTRDQWGTHFEDTYQWRRKNRHFDLPAKYLFAHITVTPDTGTFTGDFKRDVRLVEQIGWDRFKTGISYTWVVDKDNGTIAEGHPLDAAGAHTLNDKNISGFEENLNYYGHAVAWIGLESDKPSQKCKDAYSAIIAAEKKAGAARDNAKIYPHSKFAWKECPLQVMTNALPEIMKRSESILQGDWFDMATKKDLRDELMRDEFLDAIAERTTNELWHKRDVFPQNKERNTSLRQALFTLLNRSDPKK